MLNTNITIRKSATENSITIEEPTGITVIDMSKANRKQRNAVRRRLVGVYAKAQNDKAT